MKLDAKFSGVIIKAKNGAIVPPDEYIVFLAQDQALPAMLEFYEKECRRLGAAKEQLAAIQQMRARLKSWRDRHPDRLKVADVQRSELLLFDEGDEDVFES